MLQITTFRNYCLCILIFTYDLDRHTQLCRRGCHCLKLQDRGLLSTNDWVLLPSCEQGLQRALDRFATTCGQAHNHEGGNRAIAFPKFSNHCESVNKLLVVR